MAGDITKQDIINEIKKSYDLMAIHTVKELEEIIRKDLDASGIMYRLFSRKKSKASVIEKMEKKADIKYIPKDMKMQDFIGIRIVLYFKDDIDICIQALKDRFKECGNEHDLLGTETFKPQRINYVFFIPDEMDYLSDSQSNKCRIDRTFEVQIRTIFSEGWHEVEHDLRYKNKSDWDDARDLSRELNGLFAVLEICDNDIMTVCDKMAYRKYKEKKWEAMLRNHLRLRFTSDILSKEIVNILDNEDELAKKVFRFDRRLLINLYRLSLLPKTCDNAVYLMNESILQNEQIKSITPVVITRKYNSIKEHILWE